MFIEIEKFFATLLGEDIYMDYKNVIFALLLGFALMLIYGLLVRPLLNLCVGKNKSFFDVIMTVLIITVSLSIAVSNFIPIPDAGFTQEELDESYAKGYDEGKKELIDLMNLKEFDSFSKFYAYASSDSLGEYFTTVEPYEEAPNYICGPVIYSLSSSFNVIDEFGDPYETVYLTPFAIAGEDIVYVYYTDMCFDWLVVDAEIYTWFIGGNL